ncbi:MAG: PhoH family protein, partial [Cyclobacteriaceae bacterium]|nr:PhoH family protein [Cyclobacteriaceae bacterium]
ILRVNELFNSLVNHYNKFGKVTFNNVKTYIEQGNVAVEMQMEDVLIYGTRGSAIKPKTPNQKNFIETVKKNDVVFAVGPAGTGKTYIAVALAVRALKNKEIKRIIIARPAVEAGENLGFLPGDLQEKIDPYLRPVYDALDDMIPSEKLKYYRENRVIEIAPLAYMRGRTLSNAFILLDEAQNTTPMQLKMFLTRLGPNSKLIINGDRTQIDLKPNQKSGLEDAIGIMKNVKGIGFVELDHKDVVRHQIVKEIIKAYDRSAGKKW